MSLIAAAKTAAAVGNAVRQGTLIYTKSVYDEKIIELEGYNDKLNGKLEALKALRAQVPNFWDDDAAIQTMDAIDKAIAKVEAASERVKELIDTYRKVSEEIERDKNLATNLIDDAKALIDGLDA